MQYQVTIINKEIRHKSHWMVFTTAWIESVCFFRLPPPKKISTHKSHCKVLNLEWLELFLWCWILQNVILSHCSHFESIHSHAMYLSECSTTYQMFWASVPWMDKLVLHPDHLNYTSNSSSPHWLFFPCSWVPCLCSTSPSLVMILKSWTSKILTWNVLPQDHTPNLGNFIAKYISVFYVTTIDWSI